jgi:hypothetical protein
MSKLAQNLPQALQNDVHKDRSRTDKEMEDTNGPSGSGWAIEDSVVSSKSWRVRHADMRDRVRMKARMVRFRPSARVGVAA